MSRILSLVAALVATVALLLSGAMPAEAATSDWRWKGRIVTVVDQVGGYNRDSIKQAVSELNREQRALRFRYQTTSCKRGQKCATVSARTDGMSNWAAKAIPDQGRSCRIFTNAYWDGVGTRSIKTELGRCIGLRTAPEGVRSLMSRTDPAPKLTPYDLRDLRILYRR